MSTDHYLTIATSAEGFYKDKGSKFIGITYPITAISDVKTHLASLKKTYYDARHICYAYAFGFPEIAHMCSDDGEPAHSAGDPILGQIKSSELTNVMVAVVRYFGGTKLGVPGLIHAYKTAAEEAITNSKVVNAYLTETYEVSYSYEQTNSIMKMINDFDLTIVSQTFLENCTAIVNIRISKVAPVLEYLTEQQIVFQKMD